MGTNGGMHAWTDRSIFPKYSGISSHSKGACIALSTAKAEYIAMSSALHKVIPLMALMKELHTILPVQINKPNFFCKVYEDYNPQLEWQHLISSHLNLNICTKIPPFLQLCQKWTR